MRSTQHVTRRNRGHARPALAGLLATAVLAACSPGTPARRPAARASGESFAQHCADGRPSMVDVAAHRSGRTVVVTWGLPRVVAEARTYRVLRGRPGSRWDRVGELRLPTNAARRYVDPAPPPGSLRYAVVEIDACGVGPICSPTGLGQRCAVASVPAREAG
ncbi:MAG TPA: hypothetical protein VFK66_14840 [Oryzihumus sp.]|nr:hypothetical protein [Oryzihumus sp.]